MLAKSQNNWKVLYTSDEATERQRSCQVCLPYGPAASLLDVHLKHIKTHYLYKDMYVSFISPLFKNESCTDICQQVNRHRQTAVYPDNGILLGHKKEKL